MLAADSAFRIGDLASEFASEFASASHAKSSSRTPTPFVIKRLTDRIVAPRMSVALQIDGPAMPIRNAFD